MSINNQTFFKNYKTSKENQNSEQLYLLKKSKNDNIFSEIGYYILTQDYHFVSLRV